MEKTVQMSDFFSYAVSFLFVKLCYGVLLRNVWRGKLQSSRVSIGTNVRRNVACSKRSDSGERCEVKIAIKSRGGLSPLTSHLSRSLAFIFFALLFTSHRSPLSERLEQARRNASATLLREVGYFFLRRRSN